MTKWIFLCALCLILLLSLAAISISPEECDHPEIFLLDYDGNEILPKSNVPYSPKNTCGECHYYDAITNAYHFQQGRTDVKGELIVSDDMDSRAPWLISHGMYGKW